MNRSLALAAAFATAAALPVTALGASSVVVARPHQAAPVSHGSARTLSAGRDTFGVPFGAGTRIKSFAVPQHFALRAPAGSYSRTPLPPLWRYGWQPSPRYLWYPSLDTQACSASNTLWGSPDAQQLPDFSLGSLVDGKSNLLSSTGADGLRYASGSQSEGAGSNPAGLQVGFSSGPCGAPTFTNL